MPVFFLKAHDYEPVKRLADEVVSRYHYRFIVHYKQPKIVKERPVVRFVTGAHVPIVSSSGPKRIHSDLDMANLTFEETYSIPILLNLLKSNSWASVPEKELTDYEPKLEAIPEGVELVLESPHQVEVS